MMACCSWPTARYMSLTMHMHTFTIRLSLYDHKLVLLGSRKVTGLKLCYLFESMCTCGLTKVAHQIHARNLYLPGLLFYWRLMSNRYPLSCCEHRGRLVTLIKKYSSLNSPDIS
jgi:hypothetical protein